MTTIWQNDDGTFEQGCGCLFRMVIDINDTKRFIVARKSKNCPRHAFAPVPERASEPAAEQKSAPEKSAE